MGNYDGIEMEGDLTGEPGGHPGDGTQQGAGDQSQQQQLSPDGAQPGAGGQPAGQPQGAPWNEKEWPLMYRGQQIFPKDRDHLKNLAQKGFSFEQATEQYNRERTALAQQMENLRKQYAHYDQFDQMLKSNPALQEKIAATIQEMQAGGQQGQQPGGQQFQIFNKLTERLDSLESMNQERIDAEYDRRLAESVQKLKADHPDHDWNFDDGTGNMERKVIQFAAENGITNLEYAYRSMMYDQAGANAKADALKKAAAAKQQANRAGVIQSGAPGGAAPQQGGYKPGMSYNDVARAMAAEMKT